MPASRYTEALERTRRRMLRWALRRTEGRVARAARLLALNRATMYVLMRRHGVAVDEFRHKAPPAALNG
jgi:transcriptional regulator of acetoin/glycerol metabolism